VGVDCQPESRDDLIKSAASLGYAITAAQLARWHRAGLLPRPSQRSLGRGRGTETVYPGGTSVQLVALCHRKEEERRLDRLAFGLWWDGFSVDPDVVKDFLKANARSMEGKLREAVATGQVAGTFGAPLRQVLGPQRIAAIAARLDAGDPDTGTTVLPWESAPPGIPSLDDLADMLGRAMASRLADAPLAGLITQVSETDLVLARDRAKLIVSLMEVAAPFAWLYGKAGAIFKLMERMTTALTPSDYAGLVVAALAFSPYVRPDLLKAMDAGIEPPPLAEELRQILIIRERVPGAAEVFTPMAVRALLRDKEAADRCRPGIEQFVADHREQINAALAGQTD
jgi:hypothetical protein